MAIWVELAILALAPWPALRLLSIPRTRIAYTRIAWSLGAVLIAYAGVVAGCAVFAPVLLHPLAGIAAVAMLAERWRARPGYGTTRGLPPGSLGLFPRGPWVDDRFYLRQAKRYGPIFKSRVHYRPCICVLGGDLGADLLRAHASDLEAPRMRFSQFIPKGALRFMDPEDHPFYHRAFRAAFAHPVGRPDPSVLRAIARAGLARLARESACNPAVGVAPRPAMHAIVFELLVASFFALGADASDYAWLRARYAQLSPGTISLAPDSQERIALAELEAWVCARGREMVARGGEPPPCYLTALVRAHPGALDDETALGNLVYALKVACIDLTALLMWTIKKLGDAPEWIERLREAAQEKPAGGAHVMAWCIVRETLRLEQSEYVYRRAKRDIRFRGFVIPRNWRVRVLIREGHRDPAHFRAPDCFDPGRWLDPEKPLAHFEPFGLGAHACLGVPVTEAVSCLVVAELALGYDWQLVSDGPREHGWAHWEPSAKLRIALSARSR